MSNVFSCTVFSKYLLFNFLPYLLPELDVDNFLPVLIIDSLIYGFFSPVIVSVTKSMLR